MSIIQRYSCIFLTDDFVAVETTLTFNPGVTEQSVTIETIQDDVAEGDEVLIGQLTSLNPLVTVGIAFADIIIFDDDGELKIYRIARYLCGSNILRILSVLSFADIFCLAN